MSNDYYDHTTYPATGAAGSSSALRSELDSIEQGFDKLPTVTGNGSKIVAVNSGGTALEAITTTGTGSGVRATSPNLVTPVLDVATATTINKVTITTPASGATLTIANGKTLTASNTLTLTATDGSTLAIGAGGTLGTAAYTAATAYLSSSGVATVAQGGTGAATFTDGGVLIGNAAGVVQVTTAGTTGQVLTSNGAGVDPTFQSSSGFTKYAQTADQTITSAGALTIAHGFGTTPLLVQPFLKNTTAEQGFSIGDITPAVLPAVSNQGATITFDSTNIYVRYGSAASNTFPLTNKTTGATTQIINTNWSFFLRAWA